MIADWRNKWKQGDLPFLYVQLPNFMDANYLPSESQWAELRECTIKIFVCSQLQPWLLLLILVNGMIFTLK